jgi:hypothetical protein
VKNTLSSKKLDKIHVEVVRKRRYNNNNNISKVGVVFNTREVDVQIVCLGLFGG